MVSFVINKRFGFINLKKIIIIIIIMLKMYCVIVNHRDEFEPCESTESAKSCVILGRFVRTGQPDHGRTSHFENEIGFSLHVRCNKVSSPISYLGLPGTGLIVLSGGLNR